MSRWVDVSLRNNDLKDALAVVEDWAHATGGNGGTTIASGEESTDALVLLAGHAERVGHDEPFNVLSARRSGERTSVVVVFTLEGLFQKAEIDPTAELIALARSSGHVLPVNVVQEAVSEAAIGLNVELDGNEEEVVQRSLGLSLTAVDEVQLHHSLGGVLVGVEGVLCRGVEVELEEIVSEAVARVASSDSHEAEVTSNLQGVSVVVHGEVGSGAVPVREFVRHSSPVTVANAEDGIGVNVDGGLHLSA